MSVIAFRAARADKILNIIPCRMDPAPSTIRNLCNPFQGRSGLRLAISTAIFAIRIPLLDRAAEELPDAGSLFQIRYFEYNRGPLAPF